MPVKPKKDEIQAASEKVGLEDGHAIVEAVAGLDDPSGSEFYNDLKRSGLVQETFDANGEVSSFSLTKDVRAVGDLINSYDVMHNPFLTALLNRIAFVYVKNISYNSHLVDLKKGYIETGEIVEDVYVEIAKPFKYAPANSERTIYKREIPDVKAAFHAMNFQIYYKQTISNDQLKTAFISWQGVSDLVSRIIDSMVKALQIDEDQMIKYTLATAVVNGYMTPIEVQPMTSTENIQANLVELRALAKDLSWASNEYNMAGVTTTTPLENQRLILTNRVEAQYDVNALAAAFNMSRAEYDQRSITVNSFAQYDWERMKRLFTIVDPETGAETVDPAYHEFTEDEVEILESLNGVLIDIDATMIFDNLNNMTQNYNGEGLYWNYWLHAWKTFSISPFHTMIALYPAASSITSVALSPGTATASRGQRVTFEATVTGTGIVSKSVTWKVSGESPLASGTHIDGGVLYIATDETNTSLTVTATSTSDTSKSGTATVTVSA